MRVLVVGTDGHIGRALSATLTQRGHDVVGTTRRSEQVASRRVIFLDLAAGAIAPLPPVDVVVVCAAMAKFADCRDRFDLAHRVNVEARRALAQNAIANGGRVVTLSSSAVFDCMRPRARADWPPAPRSVYGRLMADAEGEVLMLGGSVVRLTKVIRAGSGVLADWIRTLTQGGNVQAFEDHAFCPLSLDTVVDALVSVVEQQNGGIFQVSGASDITYANAARYIADRLGVSGVNVVSVRALDQGIPETELTPFTSLDTTRMSSLTGFEPPEPSVVIDAVYGSAFAVGQARSGPDA